MVAVNPVTKEKSTYSSDEELKKAFKSTYFNLLEAFSKLRPLSSWSTDLLVAKSFGSGSSNNGDDVILMGMKVPIEDVFSVPGSGFGSYEEDEVVILGNKLRKTFFTPIEKSKRMEETDLDLALYSKLVVTPDSSTEVKDKNSGTVSSKPETGDPIIDILGGIPLGPSQKEEFFDLDTNDRSADWIKTVGWDLPTNVNEFLSSFESRDGLANFMSKPAADGMPDDLRRNVWQSSDSYFESRGPSPKEEQSGEEEEKPQYLPEPFDPTDIFFNMEDYYDSIYDYTKMPDGSPFNWDDQQLMDIAEDAINNATDRATVNAKRANRRAVYEGIIAKPNVNSKTNVETIKDQVTLRDQTPSTKTVMNNTPFYNFADGSIYKQYIDEFIDKYGREYWIVTRVLDGNKDILATAHDKEKHDFNDLDAKDKFDSASYLDVKGDMIGMILTFDRYKRRGLATALLYIARERSGSPIEHSSALTKNGFAFSNSVDQANPDVHTHSKSKDIQKKALEEKEKGQSKGPSPKEEFLPEPFDPSDPNLDVEKAFNFNPTTFSDGTPIPKGYLAAFQYHDDLIDRYEEILNKYPEDSEEYKSAKQAIKNSKESKVRNFLGASAKYNPDSKTNSSTISERFDENGFEPSVEVKDYVPSNGARIERYQNRYTDQYGRKYLIITDVDDRIERSFVFAVDINNKNEDEIEKILKSDSYDNRYIEGSNIATLSFDDPEIDYRDGYVDSSSPNVKSKMAINSIYTSLPYQRRGLATALLFAARQYIPMYIVHSDTLSNMGAAFSRSIDPNPNDHDSRESKEILREKKQSQGPSPKEELPVDDGGDETNVNDTPGRILRAQWAALIDGLQGDFYENNDYQDAEIYIDPENYMTSTDLWKNLSIGSSIDKDLKIAAARLIGAEMSSSAKNILRAIASAEDSDLLWVDDLVSDLMAENEDESDDYEIAMRAFDTDLNNLNKDSLVMFYDSEDVGLFVTTMGYFIRSEDYDKPDSYFTPEKLLKILNKFKKDTDIQILSKNNSDIDDSMRYVGSALFIKQWAKASNDELLSDLLQKAAVEVFDMKDGTWATRTADVEDESSREIDKNYREAIDFAYSMNFQVYTDFIKSMYKVTQEFLEKIS